MKSFKIESNWQLLTNNFGHLSEELTVCVDLETHVYSLACKHTVHACMQYEHMQTHVITARWLKKVTKTSSEYAHRPAIILTRTPPRPSLHTSAVLIEKITHVGGKWLRCF